MLISKSNSLPIIYFWRFFFAALGSHGVASQALQEHPVCRNSQFLQQDPQKVFYHLRVHGECLSQWDLVAVPESFNCLSRVDNHYQEQNFGVASSIFYQNLEMFCSVFCLEVFGIHRFPSLAIFTSKVKMQLTLVSSFFISANQCCAAFWQISPPTRKFHKPGIIVWLPGVFFLLFRVDCRCKSEI